MRYAVIERIAKSRTASVMAILAVLVSITLSGSLAQARVSSFSTSRTFADLSGDTVAKVTGGGTVLAAPTYPNTVATFGVNARRPAGFIGGGGATGRIHYDRHRNTTGRQVDAPVVLMEAIISSTPTPNGTGGDAALVGDCTAVGATCPAGDQSVVAYVEDNSDSGANSDVFKIYFCTSPATPPPATINGGSIPGCDPPEGGTLRSGNIQLHSTAGAVGETITTAAAAGVFPASASLNGVQLAGGIFGIGAQNASGTSNGDVEVQFTGMSLLGLSQQVTIVAWITSTTMAGGTATLNGTAILDMGEGPPPTGGHPFTISVNPTGMSLTIDGTALPSLPVSDGFVAVE
jgi:hypothetical protein